MLNQTSYCLVLVLFEHYKEHHGVVVREPAVTQYHITTCSCSSFIFTGIIHSTIDLSLFISLLIAIVLCSCYYKQYYYECFCTFLVTDKYAKGICGIYLENCWVIVYVNFQHYNAN